MSRNASSDTKVKKAADVKNIPARRLYRGVVEYARRLENGRQHRRNLMSVFQAEQTGLRQKLRDACEKLMFAHPLEYGKKAEELIWRKVYYEVIQLVKSNKKIVKPGSRLEILYKEYLSAAVGYYHHLLLKLQYKYQPSVDIDWPYAGSPLGEKSNRKQEILNEKPPDTEETSNSEPKKGKKKVIIEKKQTKDSEEPKLTIDEWAMDTCYRLFLCLGDLGRYLVEFGGSRPFSERFYQLSLLVKPNIGLPFNQLGTLAGHHKWWGLTAAYYYYRCLEAENKFDGADGNLQKLLDRNKKNFYQIPTDALENMISAEEYKKEHTRIFIISFLYLCDLLRPKTYATDVEITGLCKKLIDALPVCLNHSVLSKDDSSERNHISMHGNRNSRSLKWNSTGFSHHHHHQSSGDYTHVQPHVVLKMCVLCVINIHSLQSSRSNRSSAAIAFALAFFSHLLGHIITRLDPDKSDDSGEVANGIDEVDKDEQQDADENGDGDAPHAQSKLRNLAKKKKKSRMMRRRRHRGSGDSDLSEGELYSGSDLSDSDEDSDNSDSSSTTSTNSELSQEGMDDTILGNPKSSPSKPEKQDEEKKTPKSEKSEAIVDNHAGLELANSLANGPSTLASLKDISQRMFQPTVRRKILLAPSFFNNVPKQKPPQIVNGQQISEMKKPTENGEGSSKSEGVNEEQTKVENESVVEKKDNTPSEVDEKLPETLIDDSTTQSREHATDGRDKANSASEIFQQVGALHQMFASLKLLCDWLVANEKVTAACAQNSKALWCRLAKLANLIPNEDDLENMDEISSDEMLQDQLEVTKSSVSSSKNWKQVSKLPEDYILSQSTGSVQYKNEPLFMDG